MKSKSINFFSVMKEKFSAIFSQKNTSTKRKKKGKALWIIGGTVLILLLLFLILRPNAAGQTNVVAIADLSDLTYDDFENTISGTGTVESDNSHMVYSSQTYKVNEVLVEVGDYVTADQLLCILDNSSLEDQLETKETSMNTSANSSAQQVKSAKDTYQSAKDALDNGTNSSIISADSSVRTSYENWQKAQKTYDDYLTAKDDGTNSTLLSQDSSVTNARNSRDNAQATYDSALSAYNDAKQALNNYTPNTADAQVAQTAYDGAVLDQQIKQETYNSALSSYETALAGYNSEPQTTDAIALTAAKSIFDAADSDLQTAKAYTQSARTTLTEAQTGNDARKNELQAAKDAKNSALESAQTALDQAQSSYDAAKKSRDAAYSSADTTLEDYAIAVDNAYAAYQSALKSSDATKASAETSLQSNKNSLASAQAGANNDLAKLELSQLQESLDDTKVIAGMGGTVTAVNATVGSSGNGLLFVIEDVNDLIIDTTISEYDIGTIQAGMPVTIKSESTGDTEYQGTVLSIAPTSNKTAQGTTDTSGDVVFAAKVKVTKSKMDSENTDLRIGMSVRLKFIVEQQSNVLAVPYDAVYTNAAGDDCILLVETQSDGTHMIQEVPVACGLENDLSIIISGDNIHEGMQVINSPDNYKLLIGKAVTLSDIVVTSPSGSTGMGGGMPFGQ